jgi:hypothetical protein
MAYCTLPEFTTYVASEIGADDAYLDDVLSATEDAINDYCGRTFDTIVGSLTRSYVPSCDIVEIHDISDTAGATITDNGATVALTDVQFEPVNPALLNGLIVPKSQIRRIHGSWSTPTQNSRQATVSVTSTHWGWAVVPPQVKQATLILGKDVAHLRANRFGVAGFGEFGVVRVRDNPHVEMLLRKLRHPATVGV